MVRKEQYKYVHYETHPPQLFDLAADPDELDNLAGREGMREVERTCAAALRSVVDPAAADALAKHDQAQRILEFGGREHILSGGTLGYTPAPGEKPDIG